MRQVATVGIATTGVLLAGCGGVAAILATATVTTRPRLFLAAGVAAFLVADYGAAFAVARRVRTTRRRRTRWIFLAATAVPLVGAFAATALVPAGVRPDDPSLPGEAVVHVSTGSRLAVVHLAARGHAHRTPMVVLHGGPGVPDLAANARVFAPFTADGYDVYLYSQLGTGHSSRLADPRGYGRDRDTADLEALRRELGLHRMVLVGHSYGGALAAQYLAIHPRRVAALVLLSPGALDPSDTSANGVRGRLTWRQQLHVYAALLPPRPMLGYGLLQVSPGAAHAYFPDREADARNDLVVSRSSPALHCGTAGARPSPVHGSGFYAMQYPQSAGASRPYDPRPALAGLRTPTLIVKGSCDYLSWRSAVEYERLLPRARLLYLRGAGHNVQQDRPATVRRAIRALLSDRDIPGRIYRGETPPPGYQGRP